ncbi:7565_t:CDS:1 [Dentiscutata heterogama]|uniref:7565_t:CDS:1 n=1 Tax=Dentiscutata heterogama TaxID=1316150 RepID=A0ACA9JXT3_9GLOM|nr:7565_t:CDS:1 [Dentiscutata heterogama]
MSTIRDKGFQYEHDLIENFKRNKIFSFSFDWSPSIINENSNKELDIHCRHKSSYFLVQATARENCDNYLTSPYHSFINFTIPGIYKPLFVTKLAEELKYDLSDQNSKIIFNEIEVINEIKRIEDDTRDNELYESILNSQSRHNKNDREEEINFIKALDADIKLLKIRHSYELSYRSLPLNYCGFVFIDGNFEFVIRYETDRDNDRQEEYLTNFKDGIEAHLPQNVWGIYIANINPEQMERLRRICTTSFTREIYILDQRTIDNSLISEKRKRVLRKIYENRHFLQ